MDGFRDVGGTILDSHCHAWRRWPYSPLVPDEDSRGTVDQLLFEMDTTVSNRQPSYARRSRAMRTTSTTLPSPESAIPIGYTSWLISIARGTPPITCRAAPTGCGALDDRYAVLLAHYLGDCNDGWLLSDDADALFGLAAERRFMVSLGAGPDWHADLSVLARRHPSVPVLCQSLAGVRAAEGPDSAGLRQVLASAAISNIYVKVAGFHYSAELNWDYPWADAVAVLARIFDAYGPGRLCWGSDFPASKRYCTFRQSLEVVRSHCQFLTGDDLGSVLGDTLRGILTTGQAAG